jgi:ribosomal protein S18 acetylase RimI-like enzyme
VATIEATTRRKCKFWHSSGDLRPRIVGRHLASERCAKRVSALRGVFEIRTVVGRGGLEPPASAVIGPERCACKSGRPSVRRGVIRRDCSDCSRAFISWPLLRTVRGGLLRPRIPHVSVDATAATAALTEMWRYLVSAVPGGWFRANSAGLAAVTGAPAPTLNVVWVPNVDAEVEEIADLLDQVADTRLPHSLQFRPGATRSLADLAASRGMAQSEDMPLMVLEDPGRLDAAHAVTGLEIRELLPHEAGLHARVAAAGFEAPLEMFLQLMSPSVLAAPGVRCYVGEVGGQPVTTGLGVKLGFCVAIFNIATPPEHRRRGYGAAVTARAVADGIAAGAQWSWLQSSAEGYRVYERLGFRTMETDLCWITGAGPTV